MGIGSRALPDNAPPPGGRLVLTGRLLLLLLAGAAVVVALVLSWRHDRAAVGAGAIVAAAPARFACPMHAEVKSAVAGSCPICQMALEPIEARGSAAAGEHNSDGDSLEIAAGGGTDALIRTSIGLVRRHVLPQQVHAPAWIEDGAVHALLYKDELGWLTADERATFASAQAPEQRWNVRLLPGAPLPWDDASVCVRFAFARAPAGAHVPDVDVDVGWLTLAQKARAMMVVSSAAVLPAPESPYVLSYAPGSRTFIKRPVEIGKAFHGVTTIISGLKEREIIVAMNASLFDAERRLRAAAEPATGGPP